MKIYTAIPSRNPSNDPHIYGNVEGDTAAKKYQRILDDFVANHGDHDWLNIIHEDAYLISDPTRELEKLPENVGVAGVIGSMFLGPSLQWWQNPPMVCCGHLLQGLDTPPYQREMRERGLPGTHWNMATVDGFCLLIRRDFAEKIHMSDLGSTWHLYDVDICIQARLSGHDVGIIDVETFHRSPGNFDPNDFEAARKKFVDRWKEPVDKSACLPYNLGGIQ